RSRPAGSASPEPAWRSHSSSRGSRGPPRSLRRLPSTPSKRSRRSRSGRPAGRCCAWLTGLGLELVADAVARLDEGVLRAGQVELLAQLLDEDVHRSVAMGLAPAP